MGSYPMRAALAAVLAGMGKRRKQSALEDTLDKARAKGYEVDIVLNPKTGESEYTLHYEPKSQASLMKEQFDIMKMFSEMNKLKKEQEFDVSAELGFGGGAQDLYRQGISGRYKPTIKEALALRNMFRKTNQTLLPKRGGGWERVSLPRKKPKTTRDIILEKVMKYGYNALTPAEKQIYDDVIKKQAPATLFQTIPNAPNVQEDKWWLKGGFK